MVYSSCLLQGAFRQTAINEFTPATKLIVAGVSYNIVNVHRASRLTSSGKDENNPIVDNSTDEGQVENKRMEIVKM